MNVTIKPSKKRDKKYDAVFSDDKKIVSFGARGYEDFTTHKDPDRKKRYLARHVGDPVGIRTAGGLARSILWSRPSLSEAVAFASKKHGVKIKLDAALRR
jgi:hypothetical protein